MFIKSRCLYIVSQERSLSKDIYEDLQKLNLIEKFFSSRENNDEDLFSFLSVLPDQTVFSKKIELDESRGTTSVYYISLPFFSSHFKTPLKIGEYVWTYPYDEEASTKKFQINSYWLSRTHGLLLSEDVNFTFNDRDYDFTPSISNVADLLEEANASERKANKKRNQKKHAAEISSSIIKPNINFGKSTYELDTDETSFLNNDNLNRETRCITNILKKSEDTVLQGSNNTLIKLSSERASNATYSKGSSNQGEIIIAAGTGNFIESNYNELEGSFIDKRGVELEGDEYKLAIPENDNSPVILKCRDHEENFKSPSLYYLSNMLKPISNEGASRITEDSSRITLNENFSYDKDINTLFDRNLNIHSFSNSFEKPEDSEINASLKEDKTFTTSFYKSINSSFLQDSNIPSISITSSNVTLFSRLSSGGISLIKEYESKELNKNLNSYIRLDDNGDIYIDASRIFIGSYEHQKNKNEATNGNGTVVRIGESKESQPLVLGQQLKSYLIETYDVNRESMDLTKKLFKKVHLSKKEASESITKELSSVYASLGRKLAISDISINTVKTLGSAPTPGTAAGLALESINNALRGLQSDMNSAINKIEKRHDEIFESLLNDIIKAKLERSEELSLRIKSIEDNIDKILSKISKTS